MAKAGNFVPPDRLQRPGRVSEIDACEHDQSTDYDHERDDRQSDFIHEQVFYPARLRAASNQTGRLTEPRLAEPDRVPAADITGIENPVLIAAIRSTETYVMERQLKLEAGLVTDDGAWGINFGLDANSIPDPMRDQYQWLSIGGNYASDSWWLPGARIGGRHNLAASRLTYLTAGVTLFNVLNIDLASTVETITINDKTVPKGLIANIGVNVLF